jgi:hypothetical protein
LVPGRDKRFSLLRAQPHIEQVPGVKLTTHHPLPKSIMVESYLHSPSSQCGASLTNYRDKFTLHLNANLCLCLFIIYYDYYI